MGFRSITYRAESHPTLSLYIVEETPQPHYQLTPIATIAAIATIATD